MFNIEQSNVVDIISFSIFCPSGGDFIKQILFLIILKKWPSFLNHRCCCKDAKPNSLQSFSLDETLIAPVIARAALYCIDSSFWWKELL